MTEATMRFVRLALSVFEEAPGRRTVWPQGAGN